METENHNTSISQMLQDAQPGGIGDNTTIASASDAVTPMTIDESAPGDVIELSDDFDFEGYQVVRREFFAHTFEPSITFNNYKVYVNTACLNKFPHADCVHLLINRESRILALRPCAESARDAFAWCNTSGGRRKPRQVTGKFFFAKLFEMMEWNLDYRYKLLGKVIPAGAVIAGPFSVTQLVTGSLVNCVLFVFTATTGIWSGVAIGIISSALAALIGIGPAVPAVTPVIACGNAVLVVLFGLLHGRWSFGRWAFAAVVAAAAKCAFLWICVPAVLQLLSGVPEAQVKALGIMFSWPQGLTALIGGALALVILPRLGKDRP